MANEIKGFLQATKVDVIALGGGTPTFNRVLVTPGVNIQRLMQNPRWPTALLIDGGGELDQHNHKLWQRVLNVTVVDSVPRDTWGEEATFQLLDLGEALIAGLEYNTTDALSLEADGDIEIEETPMGLLIVSKSYSFAYELQRA